MHAALDDALRDSGLSRDSRFDAVVAGISGYEGRVAGVPPQLPSARVELMHDAPIAHAAALRGEPGIVVIAGTGSAAFTRARDGRAATFGGWGYLFGDEGSAFWIARRAFESAVLCADGCAARIAAYFGQRSLRDVARAFYTGAISRERFASLARECIDAPAGACMRDAVSDAVHELALLARHAALDPFDATALAFTGGLMRSPSFARRVHENARTALPGCTIVESDADPADGALLLASRL
jgi:N-acetylglucosamine kinase-like BadF-type ATPase